MIEQTDETSVASYERKIYIEHALYKFVVVDWNWSANWILYYYIITVLFNIINMKMKYLPASYLRERRLGAAYVCMHSQLKKGEPYAETINIC